MNSLGYSQPDLENQPAITDRGGISPEDEDELVVEGVAAGIFLGLAPDQTQCVWVLVCVTLERVGKIKDESGGGVENKEEDVVMDGDKEWDWEQCMKHFAKVDELDLIFSVLVRAF
ncbi:hypothetical protein E3N88_28737 [Mikania micrantha]|uniref:Uncharacterized protein n=1 Tax=Mikania micrantha TaxID=192012 RepID=A0A5N6N1B1_9ASTR|nr:hypothetical protein E3N88_28737 [Mikania micrantha]